MKLELFNLKTMNVLEYTNDMIGFEYKNVGLKSLISVLRKKHTNLT